MDSQRFDDLVRRLGSGLSRRQVLRGLLGGAGALGAARVFDDSADAQVCRLEDQVCSDVSPCCTDLVCFNERCHQACESNDDCEPSDLGPCCNAECDTSNGICFKFSDDTLCNLDGCFNCNGTNGMCEFVCDAGEVCCGGQCTPGECCAADDCIATNECYRATCTAENTCQYARADDLCLESCTECNVDGFCESRCGTDQVCCENECIAGQCCVDADCGHVPCLAIVCDQQTHLCDGSLMCLSQENPNIQCCAVGPGQDYCYDVQNDGTCCTAEECEAVINTEGTCWAVGCEIREPGDPVRGCVFFPDDSLCSGGQCCCEDGTCSSECCDTSMCEDDHDCPKDSICCAGVCREIECCIDDILTGGNPNDRCPDKCTCFEGLCVDHNQQHCDVCHSDKDCGKDECCCRNGSCSAKCCHHDACRHDHHCPKGTCCCKDGACSEQCCRRKPDKPSPGTVDTLPSTGSGPGSGTSSWVQGAALAAGAAALLGSKVVRNPAIDEPEA